MFLLVFWPVACLWQIGMYGFWIALPSERELRTVLPVLRRPSQSIQTEICMPLSVPSLYTIVQIISSLLSLEFPVMMTVSICREKCAEIFS